MKYSDDAEKIYEMMQKFHKININRKATNEMPRSEIMMLKMIKMNSPENEGVTISSLSELLKISKPAVSQVINILEDKGYVERRTTKTDRRLVYVRLTESGEERLAQISRNMLQVLSKVFARMGEEDTEHLLRLLQKLYSIVSDYRRQ